MLQAPVRRFRSNRPAERLLPSAAAGRPCLHTYKLACGSTHELAEAG